MNYWVVKGTQRAGRNDFNAMVRPAAISEWQTRRKPKQLAAGDRVFMWESSPALRLIALAEIANADSGEEEGNQFYEIRFLTGLFRSKPTLAQLRETEGLQDAAFLKAGPAVSVIQLLESQAAVLLGVTVAANPEHSQIWSDLYKVTEEIIPDTEVIFSAPEGKIKLVTHLRRERNRTLIERKKRATLESLGRLDCESCQFNFAEKYGNLGANFCEVHHRSPIGESDGLVSTTLDDLAIVCSNCHRMLHIGSGMSVETLKQILNKSTQTFMSLTPSFRDLSTFRLAGLRRFHALETAPKTIPDQWHDLHASALPGLKEAAVTYGATAQMDMPNKRLEYLAGYEVPDFEGIPANGRIIIPAAHYAVFPLDTVSEIPAFWQNFQSWLPASGKKVANSPDFERYDDRFDPATRGPFEIWIPLQP